MGVGHSEFSRISVNLRSAAGGEVVMKLVADASVLIHHYRPGVPERPGIGYDGVTARSAGVTLRVHNLEILKPESAGTDIALALFSVFLSLP